jgi:hypothetical protein
MLVLKGCIRCRGDQYVESGADLDELVCLQCGDRRPAANVNLRRPSGARAA